MAKTGQITLTFSDNSTVPEIEITGRITRINRTAVNARLNKAINRHRYALAKSAEAEAAEEARQAKLNAPEPEEEETITEDTAEITLLEPAPAVNPRLDIPDPFAVDEEEANEQPESEDSDGQEGTNTTTEGPGSTEGTEERS
jgi:hypothetical protein